MVLWVSKPRKFQWAAFRFFLIVAFVFTPCFGYLKVQNQWDQRAQIVAARTAEYERHSAAMAACEKVESPPPNRLPGMSECMDKIPAECKFDDPPFSWWPAITFLSPRPRPDGARLPHQRWRLMMYIHPVADIHSVASDTRAVSLTGLAMRHLNKTVIAAAACSAPRTRTQLTPLDPRRVP